LKKGRSQHDIELEGKRSSEVLRDRRETVKSCQRSGDDENKLAPWTDSGSDCCGSAGQYGHGMADRAADFRREPEHQPVLLRRLAVDRRVSLVAAVDVRRWLL